MPEFDLFLCEVRTLHGLANAQENIIWKKTVEYGAHIWAPELHYLDGKWYIYFAAGETENIWKIRPMY